MQTLFHTEMPEEDTLVFRLADTVRQTPERELLQQLKEYIAGEARRTGKAEDARAVEMEQCGTDFARAVLEHLETGKTPPQRKSYTLKT